MPIISKNELTSFLLEQGYHPVSEFVRAIVDETNQSFDNTERGKRMVAMFLAQLIHESAGFRYIEEIAYAGRHHSPYGEGAPGKSYHGRGFIQLSWPDNYQAASIGLGRGSQLYRHPELVSENPVIGAQVSVWYWKNRVETEPGVLKMRHFGLTTKAINGKVECNGRNVDQSKNRYKIYKALARHMGIRDIADECGCYN